MDRSDGKVIEGTWINGKLDKIISTKEAARTVDGVTEVPSSNNQDANANRSHA